MPQSSSWKQSLRRTLQNRTEKINKLWWWWLCPLSVTDHHHDDHDHHDNDHDHPHNDLDHHDNDHDHHDNDYHQAAELGSTKWEQTSSWRHKVWVWNPGFMVIWYWFNLIWFDLIWFDLIWFLGWKSNHCAFIWFWMVIGNWEKQVWQQWWVQWWHWWWWWWWWQRWPWWWRWWFICMW